MKRGEWILWERKKELIAARDVSEMMRLLEKNIWFQGSDRGEERTEVERRGEERRREERREMTIEYILNEDIFLYSKGVLLVPISLSVGEMISVIGITPDNLSRCSGFEIATTKRK